MICWPMPTPNHAELDPTNQNSVGADRYGFNPFPGRYPLYDFYPGPLTGWRPYFTDVQVVYNYGQQLYSGLKNKSQLNALGAANIGDRN